MPDLTPALLPRLLDHRLPGLDLGGDYVYPHYSGYSLLNLAASVCQALGAPLPGAVPLAADALPIPAKSFRKVVLLVVDGLGLEAFRQHMTMSQHLGASGTIWAELLPQATLAPLTSLAPSTTSAVLTTLWTGASPLQHGIIGYEVWLREYGIVANMIVHAPATATGDAGSLKRSGFVPETFLPVTQLGVHLAQQGIDVQAFMPAALARSGLSTMQMAQAHIYPYRTVADLWISLADRLAGANAERLYTYAYWPDLDTLSHVFGPQDERFSADLELFSRAAQRFFFERLGPDGLKDTLFLLTADHGQISTTPQPQYDLRNHPRLAEMLHLQPTGETRLAYLYPRPGSQGEVQRYMEQAWPGEFDFIETRQAVAAGLFGPGEATPAILSRVGDLIAVARGQSYLWWANKENRLYGRHGGLSAKEMLVPLFSLAG